MSNGVRTANRRVLPYCEYQCDTVGLSNRGLTTLQDKLAEPPVARNVLFLNALRRENPKLVLHSRWDGGSRIFKSPNIVTLRALGDIGAGLGNFWFFWRHRYTV